MGVLYQGEKSSFWPIISVSSKGLVASDGEAMIWVEMSLLYTADIDVLVLEEVLELELLGSDSLSIPKFSTNLVEK